VSFAFHVFMMISLFWSQPGFRNMNSDPLKSRSNAYLVESTFGQQSLTREFLHSQIGEWIWGHLLCKRHWSSHMLAQEDMTGIFSDGEWQDMTIRRVHLRLMPWVTQSDVMLFASIRPSGILMILNSRHHAIDADSFILAALATSPCVSVRHFPWLTDFSPTTVYRRFAQSLVYMTYHCWWVVQKPQRIEMSRHSCTCSNFIMVRVEWHHRARWVVIVSQDGPWVGVVLARGQSFEQKNHVMHSEEFHLVRVLSKGPKVCANHDVTAILSCLNDWRSHHVDCTQVKSIIDSGNADVTTPEYLWTSWRPTKWQQCLVHPVHLIQHAWISIDLDLLRNAWQAVISTIRTGLSKHLACFGWDWKIGLQAVFLEWIEHLTKDIDANSYCVN
jgi:hypothetical protein